MDVILSGWLYKSPSEKKLWNPFKQAWQKRFFVLTHEFKQNFNLELNYYDSDDRTNKKGSIDLDKCIGIHMEADDTNISAHVSHLMSNQQIFKYVFSLKTKHRNRDRIYFLGSESLESVDAWMQCLRTVLYKKTHISPCEEAIEEVTRFNSFRRPKSSDVHRHGHHSTRWGSFHAIKGTSKKPQANNNSMDNLIYPNPQLFSQPQQKHLKKHSHHQHHHQQPQYHPKQQHYQQKQLHQHQKQSQQQQQKLPYEPQTQQQQFDYTVSTQEGTFRDDLNESYVLLEQCFSGYENQIDQNAIYNNNNNNYNASNKNIHADNYYNHNQLHNNNYYNTESDDNILLSLNDAKPAKHNNSNIKGSRKSRVFTESHSCSNLPSSRKQNHSVSEDCTAYKPDNGVHFELPANLNYRPVPGNFNQRNSSNNIVNNMGNKRIKSGSRSQVMNRKKIHHTTTQQQQLPPRHNNYNSMTLLNNSRHNNNHKDYNNPFKSAALGAKGDGSEGGNIGFYTLPLKTGGVARRYGAQIDWYHKQNLCMSDHSSDSDGDDDDDDYYYNEDSSQLTESSECPCKFYNCSTVYPPTYPLPSQQQQQQLLPQQPQLPLPQQQQQQPQPRKPPIQTSHHVKLPPQRLQQPQQQQQYLKPHYNNNNNNNNNNKQSDDNTGCYYNSQSLQYLELDLDQCSLTDQQPQLNPGNLVTAQPNFHNNYNYISNNSATQYTQIDINKTLGLQDTKHHLENERRHSDKQTDKHTDKQTNVRSHKSSCPQSTDGKGRLFHPPFNNTNNPSKNKMKSNNVTNENNDTLDVFYENDKDANKARHTLLFKGSHSNISNKKRNKKSYSSTVF